jgi:hypothetical protein
MPDIRLFGNIHSWKYSAEVIYQTGSVRGITTPDIDGTFSGSALEISAGYQPEGGSISADLTYYRASGDPDPADDQLKSYNVLWQNNHRRFGYIDAFKGSNVQATTFHLNWRAGQLVDIGVHGVVAAVLEPKDKSTGIATVASLENLGTDSKSIGSGGDVYLNYYFSQQLNMQFSTAVFSPGQYFTAVSGLDKMMVRMYLMLALRI